jgi:hypothetical protein
VFTPEFSAKDGTEHILVVNHYIETEEALNLSVAFVRARISFGRLHLPVQSANLVAIYDVRGQAVPDFLETRLQDALGDVAEVRVKRT